jgi:hypothetical protein
MSTESSMVPPEDISLKRFFLLSVLAGTMLVIASCLKDKPDSLPGTLVWNPEMAFPLGTDSLGLNAESGFDTTLFELDTITNLPLWVDEVELEMKGTIEFDLSSLHEYLDEMNRILFRVNIANGFPNQVMAQAYFLDADSNRIDSMFADGPVSVPAGKIRGSGETIESSRVRKDAVFEHDRIEPLQEVSRILFQAILENTGIDTALIPYYPFYHIDVEMGAMLELTMQN